MELKVDEDLPQAAATMLRQAGHEAQTVTEEGLGGTKDAPLWERVVQENRILITADKGFADIRAYPPGTHPGVILLRPSEEGIRPVLELTRALLAQFRIEQLAGCLTVVTPTGIRIRKK